MKQNYYLFINLLNKFWVGNIDGDVEKLLKAIFMKEPDKNLVRYLAHVCTEWTAVRRTEVVRNGLPGDTYKIEADEIPENCKYSLVKNQAGQNQQIEDV